MDAISTDTLANFALARQLVSNRGLLTRKVCTDGDSRDDEHSRKTALSAPAAFCEVAEPRYALQLQSVLLPVSVCGFTQRCHESPTRPQFSSTEVWHTWQL